MSTEETFEGWMLVEIMGHRRLCGYVREVSVAGAGMLRIDVDGVNGLTQYIPPSSVYAITPVTEEVARAFAAGNQYQPVTAWELKAPEPSKPAIVDYGDPAGGGFLGLPLPGEPELDYGPFGDDESDEE